MPDNEPQVNPFVEELSALEHDSWARWMKHLFSQCTPVYASIYNEIGGMLIPFRLVNRWKRQIDTPYGQLSEAEKQSDRDEVAHILPVIHKHTGHCACCAIPNDEQKLMIDFLTQALEIEVPERVENWFDWALRNARQATGGGCLYCNPSGPVCPTCTCKH